MREQLISRTKTRIPPKSSQFFSSREGTKALFFQPKLAVGPVDDVYEREADAVAEKVMRMPAQDQIQTKISPVEVQRKCPKCEEEEKKKLQRKAKSPTINEAPEEIHQAINSGGQPMSNETKSFMENRFGQDFSQVKIHTGSVAAKSAQAINALAFTSGNNVVFNKGQYAPGTDSGKRLLAHELTHVLQQNASIKRKVVQRACGRVEIGSPLGCARPFSLPPERPRYLFNQGCNTFNGDNEIDLRADAQTYGNGETIEIHGMASVEGPEIFNRNLSCARALKARDIILDVTRRRGIQVNILVYAYGEVPGTYRPVNRSVAIVRNGPPQPTPVPEPDPDPVPVPVPVPVTEPEPPQTPCSWSRFVRNSLGIDPSLTSDFITCACLAGGILDLVDTAPILFPASPFIEAFDCTCNVLTTLQHIYNVGADNNGCWSVANITAGEAASIISLGALTYADCASLPLGAAIGGLIGGLTGGTGGSAAGPGGTIAGGAGGIVGGAAIGDLVVDLIAMGLQNYITQGTPFPVNQCRACTRLANRLNIPMEQDFCGTSRDTPQW